MEVLKFTLSGETAFFKKPEVNSYFYFTYGQIHKVAILGLFGAIIGLGGYAKQYKEKAVYPEFYEALQDVKIAIIPQHEKGYIQKKIQKFNNSTGFASQEAGGNLIVKEQWLESPKWDIYLLLDDHPQATRIADYILKKKSVYNIYLGKNDHFADIKNPLLLPAETIEEPSEINSLMLRDSFEFIKEEVSILQPIRATWRYEESLPVKLTAETNHYQIEKFILTNEKVKMKNLDNIFKIEKEVVQFF